MKGMKFPRLFFLALAGFFALVPRTPLRAEPKVVPPGAVVPVTPVPPGGSLNAGKLRIAVCYRPPFSFKDGEGAWSGLSIDLWEQIAGRLGISYTYVEMPLQEIMKKLH